jgi:hypothetical protein
VRTSFFSNVVNAGLPHRGCIINTSPTWVTRVDNALSKQVNHIDVSLHEILCRMTETLLCDLAGFTRCWSGRSRSTRLMTKWHLVTV